MPTSAIIFDFDGTLADSFEIFVESLQATMGREHAFNSEELRTLRKLSTKQIISELGVKKWQLPRLLLRGRKEVGARMHRVETFAGIPEALASLAPNHRLYIVSTNSQANITEFLERNNLVQYFTKVVGDIGLLNKSKSIKKLIQTEKLEIAGCVYVGDETRDIEAAQKVGITCAAVSWGYSDPITLKDRAPDIFIAKPADLVVLR